MTTDKERSLSTNEMRSIFSLWNVHFFVALRSTCIWSIYLSVDMIIQNVWLLTGVHANKETTQPMVLVVHLKSSLKFKAPIIVKGKQFLLH